MTKYVLNKKENLVQNILEQQRYSDFRARTFYFVSSRKPRMCLSGCRQAWVCVSAKKENHKASGNFKVQPMKV